MLSNPATAACPCGRLAPRGQVLPYAACCGRYLDDFAGTPAPDAESLMRSRYTAFTAERGDYLLTTWHPAHRPASIDFDAGVKWLGLEVRVHQVVDADHAEVEFVARQKPAGAAAVRLHERSRFVREMADDALRWFYVDGVQR